MNTLSKSLTLLVCTTSLLLMVGCDKLTGEKAEPYQTSVDYPRTPPLQPGVSISRSLALSPTQPSDASNGKQTVSLTPVTPTATKTSNKVRKPKNKKTLIVNTNIKKGTPIATLKKAMDIIYAGDAKQAAKYYHSTTDITAILVETQQVFQQGIASVEFTKTTYNDDKTEAQVFSEILGNEDDQVKKTVFYLRKFDKEWKISER